MILPVPSANGASPAAAGTQQRHQQQIILSELPIVNALVIGFNSGVLDTFTAKAVLMECERRGRSTIPA